MSFGHISNLFNFIVPGKSGDWVNIVLLFLRKHIMGTH